MYRSYKSSLLVVPAVILAGLYINTNVFADSNDVDFSITVNPSLTLALSSNTINFSITPTAQGAYNSANFTVTSATNNVYGYTLVMGTSNVDLTSNTVNPTTGTNPTIPTLTETQDGISAATFEASTDSSVLNHYGVAIGTGNNFNAMKTTKQAKKTTVNNASGVDNTVITLASKLDLSTVPGTYSTTINFQMTANPLPGGLEEAYQSAGKTKKTIGGKEYYAMQDMTSAICNAVTLEGDVIEVYDTRDNNIYHIGKLADNRCWLLDNLALDLLVENASANITPENTNANQTSLNALFGIENRDASTNPDGNLATIGVANWRKGWYSHTEPYIDITSKDVISSDALDKVNAWKIGIYYDYCAASAGSYCYSAGISINKPNTAIDVEYDICPSGWRMPTSLSYHVTDRPDGGEYQTLYDVSSGTSGTGEGSKHASFRSALRLPFSGYYHFQAGASYGSYGSFWSSTYTSHDTGQMSSLSISNSTLYTQSYGDRGTEGHSVRCIAK